MEGPSRPPECFRTAEHAAAPAGSDPEMRWAQVNFKNPVLTSL